MSWFPAAIRKPIKPGVNDPPIEVVGAILHVAVSNSDSLFDYFHGRSGGIESHFYIRHSGKTEQYRNTGVEADANYKANSFVKGGRRKGFVSIETAGMEMGTWNSAQLAEIKTLLKWLSIEHKFPLRVCPGPYDSGVGYHVLFGAPGPWTPVSKSCPGPNRIKQFNQIIVPWMADGGDADMDAKEIAEAVWNWDGVLHNKIGAKVNTDDPVSEGNPTWRAVSVLENTENMVRGLTAQVAALTEAVAALNERVATLTLKA